MTNQTKPNLYIAEMEAAALGKSVENHLVLLRLLVVIRPHLQTKFSFNQNCKLKIFPKIRPSKIDANASPVEKLNYEKELEKGF